jgi:hypothetical protein
LALISILPAALHCCCLSLVDTSREVLGQRSLVARCLSTMLFTMYLFNRNGTCLFYKEWHRYISVLVVVRVVVVERYY